MCSHAFTGLQVVVGMLGRYALLLQFYCNYVDNTAGKKQEFWLGTQSLPLRTMFKAS